MHPKMNVAIHVGSRHVPKIIEQHLPLHLGWHMPHIASKSAIPEKKAST